MCQAILADAVQYCQENPQDATTSWEILNTFINFAEGRIKDPQFWLAFKEDSLAGYMITQAIAEQHDTAVYIRQGFIQENSRGNGVMGLSLEVLEKKARESGAKFISCLRYDDAKSFGRMMGKFGYKYKATEFRKEL
jgi:hypothetical protein